MGQRVFPEGTLEKLLPWLRAGLTAMAVSNADRYTLHSLRRGAARELVAKGGSKADLCQAGSWTSQKSAKIYLDLVQLEADAAASAF